MILEDFPSACGFEKGMRICEYPVSHIEDCNLLFEPLLSCKLEDVVICKIYDDIRKQSKAHSSQQAY